MGYSSNSSSLPENLSSDQKKAIQELTHGRELANQLRVLLSKPIKNESCDSDDDVALLDAGDLVTKILDTFKNSLLFLNYAAATADQEVTGVPANTGGSSDGGGGGHKAEEAADSGESSKISSAFKDRRQCYKRRRTADSVTKFSQTLIEDGHAWRKYGQKGILNAKHPRNYFRCTHKFDQGCQATKQVQRMDDDPTIYRTTYHGHHTCRNDHILLKPLQFILDNHHPTTQATDSKSVLISFDKTMSMNHNNNINHHQSSYMDHFLSSPNTYNDNANAFGSSEMLSPHPVASDDHGDVISSGVYSSTTSNHSFEMDMMVGMGGDHMHFDDDIDSFLL